MATVVDSVAARQAPSAPPLIALLEGWHLLSLDAPTVAALWSWFFARCMHVSLPWHAPLTLAIGAWLIYVSDRIVDGMYRPRAFQLRQRHHFHVLHWRSFLGAGLIAASVLLWLISSLMTAAVRWDDSTIFLAVLIYSALVHWPVAERRTTRLPKEALVAVIFASATAVPAWSRLGSGRETLLPAVAIFGALCWLNCLAIERWEGQATTLSSAGERSLEQPTIWAVRKFQVLAGSLAALIAARILFSQMGLFAKISHGFAQILPVYLASILSCACLLLIEQHRSRLSDLQLRIAADLALLTPVVCLPLAH